MEAVQVERGEPKQQGREALGQKEKEKSILGLGPPLPLCLSCPPKMKVSLAAILTSLLLLTASFSTALAAPYGPNTSPCCTRHATRPFPQHIVKSYFYTSGHCALPSVVFVFRNGKQGCADPKAGWVQKLTEALERE